MTDLVLQLSERDLREAALALRSGRLAPPYSEVALQRIVSGGLAREAAAAFQRLAGAGFTPEQLALTLELVAADRRQRPRLEDVLELVTTGPDVDAVGGRDTAVVVRELFANARESVLVAGYAVYQGQRVFQALADRMEELPELQVRLFLDIQRPYGDTTASAELIRRFAHRFREHEWPGDRRPPRLFFDVRSLEVEAAKRASLHAKVIVVDGREVFISSANLTEAAQQRNVEVGVRFRSAAMARQLTAFFDGLTESRALAPLPLAD
jgi:phosphatidylserine/phosphatidylglycerophosphate/cardiolipin synthase-like enzyme